MLPIINEIQYIYQIEHHRNMIGWFQIANMNKGVLTYLELDNTLKSINVMSGLEFEESLIKEFAKRLKDYSDKFIYQIGGGKSQPISYNVDEESRSEIRENGTLYFNIIPKPSPNDLFIALAYKTTSRILFGTPVDLHWMYGIIRDLEEEEEIFNRKLCKECDDGTLKQVNEEMSELLGIIYKGTLREGDNMNLVGGLHRLAEIPHILKKFGYHFAFEKKWESIYFRDLDGNKITDDEIEDLRKYLIDLKKIVEKCMVLNDEIEQGS